MINSAQTVTVNNLKFKVCIQGEGKPLLLLHGFPDDQTVWNKVVPLMVKQGYQVITFDQRGCGESDAPIGRKHYKIRTIVDDIPGILDALNIYDPVAVISHDWGAAIGWGLTLFHPKRVKAHVAISVGHPQSYGRAGFYQKFIKGFYTLWFQLTGITEYYLLHGGFKRWLSRHDNEADVLKRMSRPGRLTAALNWYRANFIAILFSKWPRCTVPTLGIWSSEDPYLTEAQLCNSKKYMDAQWEYRRIDDVGHWIPQEAPEKIAEFACTWFNQHQ
jgi:pimeloyl-ACP methyl ester carboxylesterase